jgi:hypothetical protein
MKSFDVDELAGFIPTIRLTVEDKFVHLKLIKTSTSKNMVSELMRWIEPSKKFALPSMR